MKTGDLGRGAAFCLQKQQKEPRNSFSQLEVDQENRPSFMRGSRAWAMGPSGIIRVFKDMPASSYCLVSERPRFAS